MECCPVGSIVSLRDSEAGTVLLGLRPRKRAAVGNKAKMTGCQSKETLVVSPENPTRVWLQHSEERARDMPVSDQVMQSFQPQSLGFIYRQYFFHVLIF